MEAEVHLGPGSGAGSTADDGGAGRSEWRVERAFVEDARKLTAGYGYRVGDALNFDVEATRTEPADDATEHGVQLRATMRW